jgi:hypothetical protein
MDALALPALGVLIVIFLIYIWVRWLSDKEGRALTIRDEDDEDDSTTSHDHY